MWALSETDATMTLHKWFWCDTLIRLPNYCIMLSVTQPGVTELLQSHCVPNKSQANWHRRTVNAVLVTTVAPGNVYNIVYVHNCSVYAIIVTTKTAGDVYSIRVCCRYKQHRIWLILCLSPANGRRRYSVTTSLIGWVQTYNQPCRSCRLWTKISWCHGQ